VNELENLRQDAQRDRERSAEVAASLAKLTNIVEAQGKTTDRILTVMQGDPAWKQKGVIDQITDLAAFVESMKGFNFAEMKKFADEYNDFKKRILWLCGGIMSLAGLGALVLTNLEKIEKLFHH
jgi:hypothetical protein